MKIWKLTLIDTTGLYDIALGFVVRAKNEHDARGICAENCGDEGEDVWLSPVRSTCETVLQSGGRGLILRDFKGG